MQDHPIQAEGLVKNFGKTRALDGLDLQVAEGSLLALLGPNGAGKTTAVRIFTTLLKPDAGRAKVAGFDVVREPNRIKSRIGLAGQTVAIDENLTGLENLEMIGRLYHLSRHDARNRALELLVQFDLTDAAGRVAAEGTSDELKTRLGGDWIEVTVARDGDLARAAETARRQLGEVTIDPPQRRVVGPAREGARQLAVLVREFDSAGIEIADL